MILTPIKLGSHNHIQVNSWNEKVGSLEKIESHINRENRMKPVNSRHITRVPLQVRKKDRLLDEAWLLVKMSTKFLKLSRSPRKQGNQKKANGVWLFNYACY